MRWRSLVVGAVATLILVGLAAVFVWQVRLAEPADFVVPVACPAVLLAVAGIVELQSHIGRRVWQWSGAGPSADAAADFDEGEAGGSSVREAAREAGGCLGGCASVLLAIPLWLSPGLAALLTTAEQGEKAQRRAITQVYGEAAYANGLRIGKGDMLNTGFPAHPDAVRILGRRSFLPHVTALVLTLLTADWLLRRYYGASYWGTESWIDRAKLRRPVAGPRRDPPAE
jgi:hypothetical protein